MFVKKVGMLLYLIADPAQAQKSKEVVTFAKRLAPPSAFLKSPLDGLTEWNFTLDF